VIVGRVDHKRGIRPEIDLTSLDSLASVSRQHACIRFENDFFSIEDLKSRNKTLLGESVLVPFQPTPLQHGDVVCFGLVRMVFRIADR
jgi:pSer/pThr/pTyr-binding forkhead associated (FHA) protein